MDDTDGKETNLHFNQNHVNPLIIEIAVQTKNAVSISEGTKGKKDPANKDVKMKN